MQCQQVLLGYGNNQRLASLLKPYGTSVLDSQRITLVKKSHINDLYPSLEFPVVEFPSVFGPIKLSTRSIKASTKSNYIQRKAIESSPDFSENTLLAEDSEDSTSQDLNGNVSPPLNVFGKVPIVRQSSGGGPVLTKNQKIPTLWDPNKNVVLLNINDERVDTSLGKTDPEAEASLMKRTKLGKMCNDFHLRGFCRATDCPYMHEPELDYQELIVLRYRARRLFCERGSSCRVASCWYGHTCMYDKYCKQPTTCRFKDVHHVDKTAVAVWHKNRDQ